ncbi:AraC family transcriptional regulator [Paenibacillus spongiae]|uniref:AraC family transcriptional regulator n=1 Tax=Paenibacillus spongiae TaxID=2909671 RepID=A0ABY5SCR9_9BACL|nr:AraC family transcriptional regulator [Paenibacillus spongiae]UVI31325.1 AraC family transcriptional regulator [Paenibacillus spongiae]
MPLRMQWQTPIDFAYRNDAPLMDAQFHSHAFYEIYYFQSGECNYLIGDKLMTLRPGDLLLMHGMTLHCPNPSLREPYVRTLFHFDPAYIHKVLQPEMAAALLKPFEELRNIRISLGTEEQLVFERLLQEMNELYGSGRRSLSSVTGGRFLFRFLDLLELLREWCSKPVEEHEHGSLKERHVQSVVSYIEEHYAEDVTLDAIAGALHLTKPYLSNMFKEVTGTTVFKYLYNRRINQAKIMFRLEPGRSVSDVGRAVGFHHLAHFSRMFKATAGSSPEVYRRQLAAKEADS